MPVIRIAAPEDPRLADFEAVPDPVRLRARGQIVVEGRFAIETLLRERRFRVRALLLTESTHRALAADLAVPAWRDVPVYVASAAHFRIGGYDFHRGYLALADRPAPVAPDVLLDAVEAAPPGAPLLVLERVGNPDNVGGLFRNAAAFGAAAVVLSPGCADPLYRKAIRTSAGATLRLPFATAADWPAALRSLRARGYLVAALTPPHHAEEEPAARDPDRPLPAPGALDGRPAAAAPAEEDGRPAAAAPPEEDGRPAAAAPAEEDGRPAPAAETTALEVFAAGRPRQRAVALVVGAEGDGLTRAALAEADARVHVRIEPAVDSLNVATAAAIALHELYRARGD